MAFVERCNELACRERIRVRSGPQTTLEPNHLHERAKTAEDEKFEKVWAAYPKTDSMAEPPLARIAEAVEEGVDPDDLLRAVQTYATESAGVTRSKVCFADNWFAAGSAFSR